MKDIFDNMHKLLRGFEESFAELKSKLEENAEAIEPAIEISEGYKVVKYGETIFEGDEFYHTGHHECWKETINAGHKVDKTGRVYRRKLDTNKYITSAEDIVPWQYYMSGDGGLCKIYQDIDKGYCFHILDVANNIVRTNFSEIDFIDMNFRVANISEIPERCLIGKKVRTWDDDASDCTYGILVAIDMDDAYPYTTWNGVDEESKNIELIDDPINY